MVGRRHHVAHFGAGRLGPGFVWTFLIRARRAVNKRTDNRMGPKKRGGAGGLFAREARGLQVVRGVDLKGPKAAGRVTGTQWGGGVSVPN